MSTEIYYALNRTFDAVRKAEREAVALEREAEEVRDRAQQVVQKLYDSTPGHGGYWVPARLLAQIPAPWRAYAKQWSGSEQWYEEDCAAYAVMLSFPHLFPANTDWLAITEAAATFLPAIGDLDMEAAVTATVQEHRP